MTKEEYIESLKKAGATQAEMETLLSNFQEPKQENFQQDPANAETSVGSEPSTVSNLEDGLSEPPKTQTPEPTSLQGLNIPDPIKFRQQFDIKETGEQGKVLRRDSDDFEEISLPEFNKQDLNNFKNKASLFLDPVYQARSKQKQDILATPNPTTEQANQLEEINRQLKYAEENVNTPAGSRYINTEKIEESAYKKAEFDKQEFLETRSDSIKYPELYLPPNKIGAAAEEAYNSSLKNNEQFQQIDQSYKTQKQALNNLFTARKTNTQLNIQYSDIYWGGLIKSKFDVEEKIDVNDDVKAELINTLSNKQIDKLAKFDEMVPLQGSTDSKEYIITKAKSSVLKKEINYLNNKLEDIKNSSFSNEEKQNKINNIYKDIEELSDEYKVNLIDGVFANNFQLTDDVQEYIDRNMQSGKLSGELTNAFATVVQETTKVLADVIMFAPLAAINLGGSLRSSDSPSIPGFTKNYTDIDYVNDFVKKYVKRSNPLGIASAEKYAFDFSDGFGRKESITTFANMIPYVLGMAASARKGGGKEGIKLLGKVRVSKNALRGASAYAKMTALDNYYEAQELGLKDDKAFAYTTIKTTGGSLAQLLMPDANYFFRSAGKGALGKLTESLLKSANKQAYTRAGMNFILKPALEYGEEEIELAASDLAKMAVGLNMEPEIANLKNQEQTAAGTLLLSTTLSLFGLRGDFMSTKKAVFDSYRIHGSEVIQELQALKTEAEKKAVRARSESRKNSWKNTIKQIDDAMEYGTDILTAINAAPESVTVEQIDLFREKQRLLRQKKDKNVYNTKSVDTEIKNIDDKLEQSEITRTKEKIRQNIDANVTKLAEQLGTDIEFVEDDSEALSKIQKINENAGSQVVDVKSSGDEGFFYQDDNGKTKIIVNRSKSKGNIAVSQHELLHRVLLNTFKKLGNTEAIKRLKDGVFQQLKYISPSALEEGSYIKQKLEQYEKDPESVKAEEAITIFSEMLTRGIIKYEDMQQGVIEKAQDGIRRLLNNSTKGTYSFESGKDVYNFIKDYNRSVYKGEFSKRMMNTILEGASVKGLKVDRATTVESAVRSSKSVLESINDLVPKEVKTREEFLNPRNFNKVFNSLIKEGGAINNYIRSRTTSREEADVAIESVQDRLINFDPESKRKDGKPVGIEGFGEFIFANTKFGKLDARKALAVEAEKKKQETRIDEKVREVADVEEEVTTAEPAKEKAKISPLKFEGVIGKESAIEDIVDIKAEDVPNTTFKTVNDKFAGKVSSEIFNVPETKITDPTKNLTYAKKIKDGVPEPSEAGNIQNFFQKGKNAENFIKILPRENVSSETAEIDAIGENIDVSKDVLGLGLGVPNKLLKYFYNKTTKRSKGKKSQPFIWKLKDEFINPSQNVINKFKEDLGITERGQLNKYDRNIGQFLKGVAKLQGQNTANLAARNKIEKISPEKTAQVKQTIADVASAKSRVMLSRKLSTDQTLSALEIKNNAGETRFFPKVSGNIKISRREDARRLDYNASKRGDIDAGRLIYDRLKELQEEFRDREGETVIEGMSRVINKFLSEYPRYEQFLNKALTFGVDRSPYGNQELWEKSITARKSKDQASFKKPNYTEKRKIRLSWYESTKQADYAKNESKKLDDLIRFYEDFNQYINKNKRDVWLLDELAVAAQNSQSSPLRANSPIFLIERKPGTKEPLLDVEGIEEHTQPQNEAISILTGGVKTGTLKQATEIVRATYMQGFISKKNNDLLDVDFKSTMPDLFYEAVENGLKLDPGLLSAIRLSEAGINLSDVEYIPTKQTLSEYFFNDNNIEVETQKQLMRDLFKGKKTLKELRDYGIENSKVTQEKPKVFKSNSNKTTVRFSKSNDNEGLLNDLNNHDKALRNARNIKAPKKGISVFDFDDTLATTKSMVGVTMPDGAESKISATEFAKRGSALLKQGAEFDFSDFSKVVKGKPGPLIDKLKKTIDKFGAKDVYVLTARPENSATAIQEFLKGLGYELPLKNITGLANSTAEAKANWMIGKAAEGYNDFYFVDDAYKNVKAVQDAMKVLDVKSKERIAYANRSEKLNKEFNDILEAKTGIASEKEYSKAKAEVVGSNKGRFKFFIPPSAEDFVGLLYNTLSKGKLGDQQMAWYKKNLFDPYAKAMGAISRERVTLMADYKALKKQLGIVPKNLRKKIKDEGFTNEQAIRVYIWNKQGVEVPGLSKKDQADLVKFVESKTEYQVFADQLVAINKEEGYAKPKEGWLSGSITTDLLEGLGTTKRKKHLEQWQANADSIFSEANLNKLEAAYGKPYRAAVENILSRMSSGRNRNFNGDTLTGKFTDWLTGSIGTTMFFNTRSALLQTISSINFINFTDNNIFKAGKAFSNQKQYWKDFNILMNSDFLLDRRQGLRMNVNESDIADMAKKDGARGAINKLLQLGFTPTQIADSFAIASGGSTFYRNRIKSYIKEGLSQQEAESRAMQDFREIAEDSQQSSRPDKISAQQAGPLGRIVLAFANTPAQYARIIKKASKDLIAGRGDAKTNISKIIYYGAAQNLIFNALQQAIFAIGFGDSDEEEKDEKTFRIANGMVDSILRGTGIAGAFASVGKNAIIRVFNELEKDRPKLEKVGYELTKISPPISSKLSRINQAARSYQWDKEEMKDIGFSIDNPALLAGANVISATTNIPLDRVVKKTNNLVQASTQDLEYWERLALLGGWQDWEIGIEKNYKKKKRRKRVYVPRIDYSEVFEDNSKSR